jgi:N-acetylglucosaminyldiphosphoundecaprenol N-acetyl-beta-D-mannosaminyltransferase
MSQPRNRWPHETVDVLGVDISAVTLDELMTDIGTAIDLRGDLAITFLNPNCAVAADRHRKLRDKINSFDVVLTDGWGVMLASRILGRRIPARLANDDITKPLFELLAEKKARVFFMGSAPGVAEQAAEQMTRNFPGVEVAGTFHGHLSVEEGTPGGFSEAAFDTMAAEVVTTKPDFLIVGIPTPSQQNFVTERREELCVPVIMTGGAWLDHLAGGVEFYPEIIDRLQLRWAYRWAHEPRRLTYRYTVELADFGRRVLRQRIRESWVRWRANRR